MLGREDGCRQGQLLEASSANRLISELGDNCDNVVIITHDCDLANTSEPFVEVIVGTPVSVPDPQFSNARHPRRLHIKYDSSQGPKYLELRHTNRAIISRESFSSEGAVNQLFTLAEDEKRALKQWLAARYGRPAFPNSFEERLRKKIRGRSVEYHLGKILENEQDTKYLVAIFFDLDDQRGEELKDGDPYYLRISIIYDSTEGGREARIASERVAQQISNLFTDAYGAVEIATEIALDGCTAVSDDKITLADLRKVDQWRLEYISLRENPPGDFISAGQIPA